MNYSEPIKKPLTINDLNKCQTCQCDKVCNHNDFGFERCNNYIPGWISTRIALPEDDRYVLLMRADITLGVEVLYFNREKNLEYWSRLDGYWMPIPDFNIIT